MSDNADISLAADRLTSAVSLLESRLSDVVSRLNRLEQEKASADDYRDEAESFKTDRVKLAQKLDESTAEIAELKKREEKFRAKEAEFNALARETAKELERVIGQVRHAMDATRHEAG
jgi:uncharacterized coiled-coil DUF342 family protein